MSFRVRACHAWGAIKSSWLGIIIAVAIGLVFVLLLQCWPSVNSNTVSFLVGIIASIIASIIYNISSKYGKSCSAYMWILDQTEVLATYIEKINTSSDVNSCRYKIWCDIVTIRDRARELTYTADFDVLSSAFSNAIAFVYRQDVSFGDAVKVLREAQNTVTAKSRSNEL